MLCQGYVGPVFDPPLGEPSVQFLLHENLSASLHRVDSVYSAREEAHLDHSVSRQSSESGWGKGQKREKFNRNGNYVRHPPRHWILNDVTLPRGIVAGIYGSTLAIKGYWPQPKSKSTYLP